MFSFSFNGVATWFASKPKKDIKAFDSWEAAADRLTGGM